MSNGFDKIKKKWDEDPMQCIIVFAFAATAVAKVIDALSASKGRRAYAKQVNFRVKKIK